MQRQHRRHRPASRGQPFALRASQPRDETPLATAGSTSSGAANPDAGARVLSRPASGSSGGLSPAGSSSQPARKLSSLGLSLSVDVVAAAAAEDSESEEDEDGDADSRLPAPAASIAQSARPMAAGAGGQAASAQPCAAAGVGQAVSCDAVSSSCSTGSAGSFAKKLSKRPPTPGAGLGKPVPIISGASVPGASAAQALPAVRQSDEHRRGAPALAGAGSQLPANKGPAQAVLRESWGSKLSRRPPTPGVALSGASVFAGDGDDEEGGEQDSAQQQGARPLGEEQARAHGRSGGSCSGGRVRFASAMEAVKVIQQPEFDRSSSSSRASSRASSRSSSRSGSVDRADAGGVDIGAGSIGGSAERSGGSAGSGAREPAAASAAGRADATTLAAATRVAGRELRLEAGWGAKLAKRPPTPGVACGQAPKAFELDHHQAAPADTERAARAGARATSAARTPANSAVGSELAQISTSAPGGSEMLGTPTAPRTPANSVHVGSGGMDSGSGSGSGGGWGSNTAGDVVPAPPAASHLSAAIMALVDQNRDLGIDLQESAAASTVLGGHEGQPAAARNASGGGAGSAVIRSWAAKLSNRPPTPGVAADRLINIFKSGRGSMSDAGDEEEAAETECSATAQRALVAAAVEGGRLAGVPGSTPPRRRVTFEEMVAAAGGVLLPPLPEAGAAAIPLPNSAPGSGDAGCLHGERSPRRSSSGCSRRRVTFEEDAPQAAAPQHAGWSGRPQRVTFEDQRCTATATQLSANSGSGATSGSAPGVTRRVTFEDEQHVAQAQQKRAHVALHAPEPELPHHACGAAGGVGGLVQQRAEEVDKTGGSDSSSSGGSGARGAVAALRRSWDGHLSRRPPTPGEALTAGPSMFKEPAPAAPEAVTSDSSRPAKQINSNGGSISRPEQAALAASEQHPSHVVAHGVSAALRAEMAEARGGGKGKLRPPTPGATLGRHFNMFADDDEDEDDDGGGGNGAEGGGSVGSDGRGSAASAGGGGFASWSSQVASGGAPRSAPAAAAAAAAVAQAVPSAVLVLAGHNPDLATDLRESGSSAGAMGSGGGAGLQAGGGRAKGVAAAAARRPPTPGATLGKQFNMFADDEGEEQGGSGAGLSSGPVAGLSNSGRGGGGASSGGGVRPAATAASKAAGPKLRTTSASADTVLLSATAGGLAADALRRRSTSPLQSVTTAADAAAEEAAARKSPLRHCSSASDPDPARTSLLRVMHSASGEAAAALQAPATRPPEHATTGSHGAAAAMPSLQPTRARLPSGGGAPPLSAPLQRLSSGGGSVQLVPGRMSRASAPSDLEPGQGSKLRHASPSPSLDGSSCGGAR